MRLPGLADGQPGVADERRRPVVPVAREEGGVKITPAGWAEATSILADLAEELARARDRIDWRPIETAPKDGTRVLLCCTGGAGSVSDGCFYNNAWSWEWAGVVDPTHWAPLNLPGDEG